jgi:hypothetical protein
MTTDKDRYRALTAAAVLVVAAIAAVVSYLHIAKLALTYGQEPVAAYLLPLSIDGVVATSSLVMLRAARAGVSSPWLARTGLGLSVAATLAANIASGLGHGWHGALLAGWPAIGFVLSAETAISMSRRRPARHSTGADAPAATTPARQPKTTTKRAPRASDADTESRALAELVRQPDLSGAELGRLLGASPRTGQRILSRLN